MASQQTTEKSLGTVFGEIDSKWQKTWADSQLFKALEPVDAGKKPKFYCLDMFPYPSGQGLHVGHPLGYVASDILCRYKRMKGFNVLHPMGWDAFGLPAEQHAIDKGVHPAITTEKNIETYKRQLSSLGLSYDWSREINTTDPKYYRWTQWIFKKLYERGLAYQAEVAVNWCPALGTVLANDEVIDGKSERGGHPVEKRPMRQWVLRITDYADRLLEGLDKLDWPESTKELQRNWIGKSQGAHIVFPIGESESKALEVFTTRPDTLFGVTYMVVAPEHPLLDLLTTAEQSESVNAYVESVKQKTEIQRSDATKEKTGVFTGGFVCHPLTRQPLPVWVADYVLMGYGTGAIMAVPAHDDRDREFAEKFSIPIIEVISEDGIIINSPPAFAELNGLKASQAIDDICAILQTKGLGKRATTYRLRDWVFARQRYWGEPIPVIRLQGKNCESSISLLEDDELPLTLPKVETYLPSGTGESPLSTVSEWVNVKDPKTGEAALRETNTMPGSAGSSWYFLRYMDPHNDAEAWSKEAESYWGPVDFYLGGPEHAVGHLLYARFWQKVFFDMGLVSHDEPFKKLFHQGMILGEDGEKMSKSRGNVVNPDDVIAQYGADTFRIFEMFLGPLDKAKPWQTANIEGTFRYLGRVWRFFTNGSGALSERIEKIPESEWPDAFRITFNKTIQQVTKDVESLSYNTAISALMVLMNEAYSTFNEGKKIPRYFAEVYTKLLSPFAPHLGEELWQLLGNESSVCYEPWPKFDESKTVADTVIIGIQVNGKLRDQIEILRSDSEEHIKGLALASESVKKWCEGKQVVKVIYVKEKIVSVVVK
jgi:leucyl-tRNA synthetase